MTNAYFAFFAAAPLRVNAARCVWNAGEVRISSIVLWEKLARTAGAVILAIMSCVRERGRLSELAVARAVASTAW